MRDTTESADETARPDRPARHDHPDVPDRMDQMDQMDTTFGRNIAETRRQAKERREVALASARDALRGGDRDPSPYISAARACKQLGRLDEALEILQQGIARCAPSAALHEYYLERLEKCNRTEQAIAAARRAMVLFPDELLFRLREALCLPIFYRSRSQIESYRRRFSENLARIVADVPLETPSERQRALAAIGRSSNKYLPYQGYNDCELQSLYGAWVQRVMAANYPQWADADPMPPLRGKLRVGFISAFSARFQQASAGKLFGGWVRELDRDTFEVSAYHADNLGEPNAGMLQRWNVPFRQFSGGVADVAAAIRADRLHALIYLDFGIHPRMAQLAALRLAPLQCVSWDTPLTSGVPAMDYFLSSATMEPQDVSRQYSEELVRLPGVGVSFAKPVIPAMLLSKRRADFGLRDTAVVFLCCQSIFKYSPEQDELIARIAQRVPDAQFVFLITNDLAGADFRARMSRTFSAVGLQAEKYCIWLGEMDVLDYWNLHQLGDVSLDTMAWSGGVSTFEAIACGLPVVTLPGPWLRSRHAYAILRQLGFTETVARDPAEYVEIAVRLALDREWRRRVKDCMLAAYPSLYSDSRSIRALEDFLPQAVRERLP